MCSVPVGLGAKRTLTVESRVIVSPRTSSFPLQTGRVYHSGLLCLRAPPADHAARPSHRRSECPTTRERRPTSTPRCATARPATRPSTRRVTSWARARRRACASSSATRDSPSTSPWPAASRTRASPRTSSASPRTTPPRRGAASARWFLVNGSTSGVHALVLALCSPGDTVIVPRNAHKSMLAGLIFSGAMPLYMEPAIDPLWGIPLNVRAADALAALAGRPTHAPSSSHHRPTTASAPTSRRSPRSPTPPACRSSPTRRGARTCASAPSCPSTP